MSNVDPKLVDMVRSANLAEAKVRYARLLDRAGKVATENYVRYCIGVAQAAGYNLLQGDIALVHPADLPPTIKFEEGRDPVYAIHHPEVVEGKMLLVRKHLKYRYLIAGKVVH